MQNESEETYLKQQLIQFLKNGLTKEKNDSFILIILNQNVLNISLISTITKNELKKNCF